MGCATREERGPGDVRGANRKDDREHVADRIGEEPRGKRRWVVRIENRPPADRPQNQRPIVHDEPEENPTERGRSKDCPDLAEIRVPQEEPEKENRDRDDERDL